MSRRVLVAGMLAAAAAASPSLAHAQADNSNSLTGSERASVAVIARAGTPSLLRWLREESWRRDPMHVAREGLSAAELGLLYGTEFAFGAGTEGPVPVQAP